MTRIPQKLYEEVRARAEDKCEYCYAPVGITLSIQIDHIEPVSEGGVTTAENLCLSCNLCNGHKATATEALDPETQEIVSLFNPRRDHWSDHFTWSDNYSTIIGTTAIGRATVKRLRMNRSSTVGARRHWIAAGWYPPRID